MLTPFLFCFTGYYNGCEKTLFVMIQGIIGAFFVRIPVAYLMSRMAGATLFQIGLSTPASSVVQILLCLFMFLFLERRSAGPVSYTHLPQNTTFLYIIGRKQLFYNRFSLCYPDLT